MLTTGKDCAIIQLENEKGKIKMIFIKIFNFETEELTTFKFDKLIEAETFAENYNLSEDEELSIGNEFFGMEYSDYLAFGGRF